MKQLKLSRPSASEWFASLSGALSWKDGDRVLMLWAYFDESGEHEKQSGSLLDLSLGGCVADCSEWKTLTVKWEAVLRSEEVSCFHMVDFEARKGEFSHGWDNNERRHDFFGRLLKLMIDHVDRFVGFAIDPKNLHENNGEWHSFSGTRGALQSLIYYAMNDVEDNFGIDRPHRLNMMFSRHKEIKPAYFDKVMGALELQDRNLLGATVIHDPCCIVALQAADIWAYEFARHQRAGRDERYAIKELRKAGKSMRWIRSVGGMPG